MAIRPILLHPDDRLRVKCKKVGNLDARLRELIEDMLETMRDSRGVGLAAPQLGVPLRIVTIELPEDYDDPRAGRPFVLVNPEIVKSAGEWEPDEGCLSIPGYAANVKRFWAVTVKARDKMGREIRVKGDGLLGQALQHEIDHLNGTLFIDRLESMDQLRKVEREPAAEPAPA
ncbi:MAG TPA: peptide deformylase [Chloroflexota bacterium]|jgi:peptide deformylase|nr:peptide deformylase [Chloroflexota bacterium]